VNAPVLTWPESLDDSAIDEFEVVFHILIDETGRVFPVRIVENSYPELNEELMEFASRVRFSPPTRLGVPVRTEYLWPVLYSRY
jgi:TonB family protein